MSTAAATLVATRVALVDALTDRANLAGVQVVYAWPGEATARECVFTQGGDIDSPVAALRGGRKTRNLDATFELVVRVEGPGADQETVDTRAAALAAEVDDYLADNPAALAATVPGLVDLTVDRATARGGIGDGTRVAEVVLVVRVHARLT